MSKKTPAQLQAEYQRANAFHDVEQAHHNLLKHSTHENAIALISQVKAVSPYLDGGSIQEIVKGEIKHAVPVQRSKRLRP